MKTAPRSINPCRILLSALAAIAISWCGVSGAQAMAFQKLQIVGGLGGLNQFVRHEEPFWTKQLATLSAGKYSASIVPFDRAGVPAQEMLKLMRLGVVPFGTALLSQISSTHPEFGAPDLAGLNPDVVTLKKVVTAYRPYLEKTLRDRYGIELLAIYIYPAQEIFCKKPFVGLADLAGRRTRVSSATQSDFVRALKGIPVLTGFAELMSNMTTGNTECAITGTMSGNTLGLHGLTSHIYTMPVSWGLAVFAANRATWTTLPDDLRSLLLEQLPKLEQAVWAESERETGEGVACNVGAASCAGGRKGTMIEVLPSPQDEQRRQEIFATWVLPAWIQRCGPICVEVWNQTIGPVLGIKAPAV